MKKLLKVLALALALCLLCGMALADDDDDSKFAPDGTPWNDATREHEGYLGDYVRVVEPTCTSTGVGRYTCSFGDGHFHELVIPMLPHQAEWVTVEEPTCTEDGLEQLVCTVCGTVLEEKAIPALGHEWSHDVDGSNWGRVTKEPTCTEEGEAEDYCHRCDVVNDFVQPRIIEKLPHVFLISAIDEMPNCITDGKGHDECVYGCGTYRVGPDTDADGYYPVTVEDILANDPDFDPHAWDEWVVEKQPTCYATGLSVRWCKRCADKQEITLDALEPIYVKVEPSRLIDCYHEEITERCVLCGGKADADGNCPHPDIVTIVDVVAHAFKHLPEYEVERVEPTCTMDGYVKYRCVFEADCPHTVGDKYEYEVEVLPALGHDWGEWIIRHEPGEQNNEYGYWLRECNRCHQTEERISYFAPECKGEHTWVKVETDVEPTCTTNGTDIMQCSVCGKYETVETAAKGHDEAKEVFEPTCEAAGYTRFVCNTCGNVRVEEGKEALGHDWDEGKVVIPVSCELDGKTLYTCNTCNGNKVEIVPATGHTEEEIPAVDPTCTEAGLTAGSKCTVCKKIVVEQVEIPATGVHNYEKIAGTEPTCTEEGLTDGMKCTMCGDEMIAQKALPALGHDIQTLEGKEATCTEDGLTEGKVCTRCDDPDVEVAQEVIPALGHAWDEGIITTEATPNADGVKTYTCTACGETKEEAVPYVFGEVPGYTLTNMSYSNNKITGTAVHDPSTVESQKLYARVTVFFVGGTYAVFADYVEDGVIDIEVHGTVLGVSVNLTGTKNVVPGAEMVVFDSWGEYYR